MSNRLPPRRLGQVYRAKLFTGEEVAVKVQRPNLNSIIKGDIEILRKIAKFAERFPSLNENADWAGMLREFDETVHEEMDYSAEGRNAERFQRKFQRMDKRPRSEDLLERDERKSSDDGIYSRHESYVARRIQKREMFRPKKSIAY